MVKRKGYVGGMGSFPQIFADERRWEIRDQASGISGRWERLGRVSHAEPRRRGAGAENAKDERGVL